MIDSRMSERNDNAETILEYTFRLHTTVNVKGLTFTSQKNKLIHQTAFCSFNFDKKSDYFEFTILWENQ